MPCADFIYSTCNRLLNSISSPSVTVSSKKKKKKNAIYQPDDRALAYTSNSETCPLSFSPWFSVNCKNLARNIESFSRFKKKKKPNFPKVQSCAKVGQIFHSAFRKEFQEGE